MPGLRWVDHSDHARSTVGHRGVLGAVEPDGLLLVFHLDGEGLVLYLVVSFSFRSSESFAARTYGTASCAGDESGEDAMAVRTGIARVVEVGLHDCVVLREELEYDLVAGLCNDGVGCELKPVLADRDSLRRRASAACTTRGGN